MLKAILCIQITNIYLLDTRSHHGNPNIYKTDSLEVCPFLLKRKPLRNLTEKARQFGGLYLEVVLGEGWEYDAEFSSRLALSFLVRITLPLEADVKQNIRHGISFSFPMAEHTFQYMVNDGHPL